MGGEVCLRLGAIASHLLPQFSYATGKKLTRKLTVAPRIFRLKAAEEYVGGQQNLKSLRKAGWVIQSCRENMVANHQQGQARTSTR